MPNTCGIGKKRRQSASPRKNNSGCSSRSRSRKRRRCKIDSSSENELEESELEDCNMEDAIAIEKKIRKIARSNALSGGDMRKLLQKFVKNEHILALVTLKAEDELAREKQETEKEAFIITDTPTVPKLTRARARELNRTPVIALPAFRDTGPPEITSLIRDDLRSDEDDEEYTFKEDDFVSDDDHNTATSDMDSNPCTPSTPGAELEESPVKFSEDGCFKIPYDKQGDLRIATRTRSKFCLQQTTIEDLQLDFVPPDEEHIETSDAAEHVAHDEDWMEFLNDFSKPLNHSFVGDDDDPVNDPEYVAAEKIPVDAWELRDVNISKKELNELVAELFEGLLNEGVSLESIELETPQKFLSNQNAAEEVPNPSTPPSDSTNAAPQQRDAVTRQIDFDNQQQLTPHSQNRNVNPCVSDATISSTNLSQNDCSFQPDVMSTPYTTTAALNNLPSNAKIIPIATVSPQNAVSQIITIPEEVVNTDPEVIAVPVAGQPNCYQLAKVVSAENVTGNNKQNSNDTRYTVPYDTNYTWKYISMKKHLYSEYMNKFENLKNLRTVPSTPEWPPDATGFTQQQHDLLQQQLCIHVQLLTQNFLQTYCHPDLWQWADKPRDMLLDLKERAQTDASFNAWNLNEAVDLITKWKEECSVDSKENREMMEFINNEANRTGRNTRQVARFPPRIMELMLNSTVFMYPEYLPRVPFTQRNKGRKYEVFSPSELLLLALGLEKHMVNGRNVNNKPVSLRRACERISKDLIMGKTPRRIWDQIKILRTADYYNPIKYFFEHGRPPPVECKLYSFPGNIVLPPKERISELPLAWQKYIKQRQANNSEAVKPAVIASEEARASYLEFVREAVGPDIHLPDNFRDTVEVDRDEASIATATEIAEVPTKTSRRRKKRKEGVERSKKQSVTINVNYILGADTATGFLNSTGNNGIVSAVLNNSYIQTLNTDSVDNTVVNLIPSLTSTSQPTTTTSTLKIAAEQLPVIAYNFDVTNNTWIPSGESLNKSPQGARSSKQKKLTDYYDLEQRGQSGSWEDIESGEELQNCGNKKKKSRRSKKVKKLPSTLKISRSHRLLKQRRSRGLRRRCAVLLENYRLHLEAQIRLFKHKPLVQFFFKYFKALDLYTDLLCDLKMNCKNQAAFCNSSGLSAAAGSPQGLSKRSRSAAQQQDEEAGSVRSKKANRQEENFKNMLLPDSAEDANRKDAIYAFNFYEKVEEMFKASNRPEDCETFNNILKTFDPKRDKVSELYYKLENLFLPDFPELAEVFLTFLLPSEAAEIGKFFEHFMATNMNTFINKLNIYFHKQPAQIRKVYNCLSELAEDQDVTLKKVEAKILPLLKGNDFLVEWFMQLFPMAPPPERLLSTPENVNLKEVENNQSGTYMETVSNLLDSPTQEQQPNQHEQQHKCQLRYINGRIFYGSKTTLPAKLNFMAQKFVDEPQPESEVNISATGTEHCIHAIREHGEKHLISAASAAAAATTECSGSDDNDKSKEDDASNALIIDTTTEDDSSCSTNFEVCDEASLHAHAVRLNPHYYGTSCYTNSTSTQATGAPSNANQQAHHHHHSGAKRGSVNSADEAKLSPRKQPTGPSSGSVTCSGKSASTGAGTSSTHLNSSHVTAAGVNSNVNSMTSHTQREKRKSPTKKATAIPHLGSNKNTSSNIASSPLSKSSPTNRMRVYKLQPMVVIHEQNSAIACAKKLKSLVEYGSESESDTKSGITIVAKAKYPKAATATGPKSSNNDAEATATTPITVKIENTDDLEFISANEEVSLSLAQSLSPTIKVDADSIVEDDHLPSCSTTIAIRNPSTLHQHGDVSSTHLDSDEDCKLDIVAHLATSTTETNAASSCSVAASTNAEQQQNRSSLPTQPSAWTRDEDKVILIEMKIGSRNREDLFQRISAKLPNRNILEIRGRHQFLLDFLSKLQGN